MQYTMGKTTKKQMKKSTKKGGKKMRRSYPKVRVNTGVKAYAVRSETFSIPVTAGTVTDFRDLNLNQYTTTCKQIAQFYATYRIKSVQMRFKPNNDTYQAGNNNALPYLYWQIDRKCAIPNQLNAAYFEDLGIKAVRLDDKTVLRSYTPSVLLANVGVGVAPNPAIQVGGYKLAPWLPCNALADDDTVDGFQASDIEHHGCIFYISKTNTGDSQVYDVDVTITVEFSKPLAAPVSAEDALPYVKAGTIVTKGDLDSMGHLPPGPSGP